MKKFIFIRHGLSTSNRDKIVSGSLDVPLAKEGIAILEEMYSKNIYPETECYVSSSLSRCLDTFKIIGKNKKLDMINDCFKEINFGNIQGTSPEINFLDDYFTKLFSNELISDNELYEDFSARVQKGIKETYTYMEENKLNSVTVICHSTVIKSIVHNIINIPINKIREIRIKNGQGIAVDIDVIDNKILYSNLEYIKY